MVPPLIPGVDLERYIATENPRNIYLLYEGEATEPLLFNELLKSDSIIKNHDLTFIPMIKDGKDSGVTTPKTLVNRANKFIQESIAKKEFTRNRDKIIIFFDLDVCKNNKQAFMHLVNAKDQDIILCYTNPAIELFLLLTIKDSYKLIIKPNEREILENKHEQNGDRFVVGLAKKYLKINPKKSNSNFSLVYENIGIALEQEKYLNRKISEARFKLTSNIAYVLNKISNDDFEIEY